VVPKSMWQKLIVADENNLIPMVTNIFLLKAHGKNFLFDIGFGDTLSEREMKIYGVEALSQLDQGLAGYDLTTDDIDYVEGLPLIGVEVHRLKARREILLLDSRDGLFDKEILITIEIIYGSRSFLIHKNL